VRVWLDLQDYTLMQFIHAAFIVIILIIKLSCVVLQIVPPPNAPRPPGQSALGLKS